MKRRRSSVTGRFLCGDGAHAVVTVTTRGKASRAHRREPCAECPWRKDVPTGVFPPDAFRHSANTAEDGALHRFACHMSGGDKPATCAGFLLRNARHNMAVRLSIIQGRYDPDDVGNGGAPLYESYRAMAIANGVAPNDPALARTRADDEESRHARAVLKPPA